VEPAARLGQYTIPWGFDAISIYLAFRVPAAPVNHTNHHATPIGQSPRSPLMVEENLHRAAG
jgi:hypothetical protein